MCIRDSLKTVSAELLADNIGYMRIISFDGDTDVEVESALNSLLASGMQKLILDLRDNGGGDFDSDVYKRQALY